ncbi:MAG: zinc ABC transporter substrate-binding protein [Armatimonadetes bacterium]|nr:zinc ABC transporter substrate-binding protein [Armatimonadota bacterium]
MRRALVLTFSLLALAGCRPAAAPAGRPIVAATIFPLASLVQQLVGSEADVVTLAPSGASPHTLDLTPETARQLSSASLVVRVGPGLDDWVANLAGPRAAVFEAMGHVTLLDGNPETDHDHLAHTGGALDKDPHVWLDPDLMGREFVPALAARLTELGIRGVEPRAAALRRDLAALDAELSAQLKPLRQRRYAGAHPAWGYFNRRYGLEMVAAVEPVGGSEPSARWLREVIETVKAKGAGCLFTEVQLSDKLDRAVAKEAGVRVGVLDPLGGPDIVGRNSYAAIMRYNAKQFVDGLGGS